MLKLASQRGDIDCGGLDYLIVRYGRFFQFVLPTPWGHVSVCFEPGADPVALGQKVRSVVRSHECPRPQEAEGAGVVFRATEDMIADYARKRGLPKGKG